MVLSSLGDATSLAGGTLLPTELKGLDNHVYAIAQGPVSIGGFEVPNQPTNIQRNHLTVARIPNGASVEREVRVNFANKDQISLSLKQPDFTTVERMLRSINKALGGTYAAAVDGSTVAVKVPEKYAGKQIALLAELEGLEVNPDTPARVILDERTGTVVMGENVRIGGIAVSHGNLNLQVSGPPAAPGRPVFRGGRGHGRAFSGRRLTGRDRPGAEFDRGIAPRHDRHLSIDQGRRCPAGRIGNHMILEAGEKECR